MLIYAKIVIQLELLLEHIVELTHGKFKKIQHFTPWIGQNSIKPDLLLSWATLFWIVDFQCSVLTKELLKLSISQLKTSLNRPKHTSKLYGS